jgi:nucleoside-diphosphate-sugar epimerase
MRGRILVTGASGFIGVAVCKELLSLGFDVRGSHRSPDSHNKIPAGVERVQVPSIGHDTDWSSTLASIDGIVHLAARVHVMKESASDLLAAFRRVNTAGTQRLARMAAGCGVRRLVYVSSVKVNGEQTTGAPFTEADPPRPEDAYAISKWEAEQVLRSVAAETGLEVVVLRPPLVYGKEVGANFLQLMELVRKGIPMPFARVRNRRSLLYSGNLADAISLCLTHPRASGQTFLVCDGEDVSTAELVGHLAKAFGRPTRLLAVPPTLLRLLGRLSGKSAQVGRLLESLAIDSSEIRRELEWAPPYSMSKGLQETANWYLAMRASNCPPHTVPH